MEVTMSRETDWMVFEKAVEVTASAVRGTAGGSQPASYVADVFRRVMSYRDRIRGFEITYQAPALRHFTARLRECADVSVPVGA